MSIIERALDKLEKQRHDRKPTDPEPEVDEGSGLLGDRPDVEVRESPDSAETVVAPLRSASSPAVEKAQATVESTFTSDGDGGSKETVRSREVVVDLFRLGEEGYLSPENPQTTLSEQMRRIKRPLLSKLESNAAGAHDYANLIMVTSSLPAEGKTFTSINLAISIAMELDRTVLLVDSDVAKSDVTKSLGIEAARGLTDYLVEDDLDLAEVLLRTNIPKLSVLPSGSHHQNMTELLASGGMKHLIDDLSSRYSDRVVIFDSPPVLVTSGASVLASLVGQVVFIVHAEKTLASQVKDALKQLNRKDNVGLVLNRSREWGTPRGKYGYYYYYGRE